MSNRRKIFAQRSTKVGPSPGPSFANLTDLIVSQRSQLALLPQTAPAHVLARRNQDRRPLQRAGEIILSEISQLQGFTRVCGSPHDRVDAKNALWRFPAVVHCESRVKPDKQPFKQHGE